MSDDPFFHFEVDGFLPDLQYHELLADFPRDDHFAETIEGNKKRLNSRTTPDAFAAFCRDHPSWQELFDELAGGAFLNALHGLVRPALLKARGPLGARPWSLGEVITAGGLGRIASQRVIVSFEFSRLESGSSVPPHTDDPGKLVTMMLYFADPAWQESYGGGTVYYRPKNADLRRNWYNRRVPFEDLEPVVANCFTGNQLAAFVKSSDSYHGLPPIACPEGMARNSLNINVFVPKPAKQARLVKLKNDWAKQRERRAHPY